MKRLAGKTMPRKAISWDECFMRMAHLIAERSKDPSTQSGAVIVDDRNVVVGMGYNGFPRGISNDKLPWDKKGNYENTKYAYICHSEENAIYNANNSTKGTRIYCTLFPCNECVKTIIQNGIEEIIYESDKYRNEPPWKASRRMLGLAKVKARQYKRKNK
ncbi:MAG TPA: dCMP deaminase family protein [Candidatus Paceibacterota bacterium]|jgi:dCMP deaminase|nr:dCMP deaminase family protein [Candidatus Paceibacterota bacterium]